MYGEDHIGHLDRVSAAALCHIMDLPSQLSCLYDRFKYNTDNVYGISFYMYCLLKYRDTTHAPCGYRLVVVLESQNNVEWLDPVKKFLIEKNIIFKCI